MSPDRQEAHLLRSLNQLYHDDESLLSCKIASTSQDDWQ